MRSGLEDAQLALLKEHPAFVLVRPMIIVNVWIAYDRGGDLASGARLALAELSECFDAVSSLQILNVQ